MNKLKVSVVVPVYNVENYIDRCVSSILSQTYTNIEIILVDDGSNDSSGTKCDDLAHKDSRIKVFHKINGGLASARNTGILLCSGEYLCFVDSDDWIAPDTIEYCVSLISINDETIDVVEYGMTEINKYSLDIKQPKEKIKTLNGKDILQFLMYYSTKTDMYFSACRCMYKTSLVQNNLFVEGKINEDISWKYKVFSQCSHILDSNQVKYFYYQGTGSITTDGLKKRDFDLYEAANGLIELTLRENYGTIRYLANVKKARTPLSLLCKIAFYGVSDSNLNEEEIVSKLRKELKANIKLLINSPIPVSRKIIALMMCVSFRTTKGLVSITKKLI